MRYYPIHKIERIHCKHGCYDVVYWKDLDYAFVVYHCPFRVGDYLTFEEYCNKLNEMFGLYGIQKCNYCNQHSGIR